MENCPTPEELRCLLEGLLSDGEATVVNHIEACSGCAQVLDDLSEDAGNGTPLPRIGDYEIRRELGRGGMGVVYLAFDRRRNRRVALKLMQWIDPVALARFKQEFRSLARLHHPNLVTLYEIGTDGQQWFFTTELVEGGDFLSYVRGGPTVRPGPLGPAQTDRLRETLRQLADCLAALHTADMLHRDLKPGNVLVTPKGRVVVLDLGLSAELDHTGTHQSPHPGLLGTIAYMAPEQALCDRLGPACDWYAVGVMLYEALTGRLPYLGSLVEILARKQRDDAPHPMELAPEAPADLVELCMELLRRDPAARPKGAEVLRRLGAAPPTPLGPGGLEVPLVGRRQHLDALEAAFEATRRGRTVVLAVHGRSGVGKTALVRYFLDALAGNGDVVVLSGRCYEQESVPYKALDSLIDSLSRYLEGLQPLEAEALLPRDVGPLARVFPVLRQVEAVERAPRRGGDATDPQELRRRAIAALRELLARLGDRRPLVLAIDDLQWGDADSAAILAELLRPPDPPVLLLIGSYRSEDVEANPALVAFARLAGRGGVEGRTLAVEPLTPDEQRALAWALLPAGDPVAEAHAERIVRQSGGYPFFVHELVQYLRGGRPAADGCGPSEEFTLAEVLWSRVQRLPATARVLLEVVAVAGRPVGQEEAREAAGLPGEEGRVLPLLRAARLLRGAGPGERQEVETYHDGIRETLVARLAPDVRRQHHRRLAEVLETAGADPEVLAIHFQGGGEPARAGHYCAAAAGQAAEALAFDRAATLYRRALQLLGPSEEHERHLRTRLGDVLAAGGRGAEAAGEYLAAAAGAPGEEALELQRRAALQLLSSGRIDAGLATLGGVLAAVGLRLPASPRQSFWSLVWLRLRLALRGLRGRRSRPEEVPSAERTALDVCQAAAIGLSMVDTVAGAYFQCRALLLAFRAGEPSRLATALAIEAAHESIAGTWGRGRTERLLRAAHVQARTVNSPYLLALVKLVRGIAAALAGDWPDARAWCDQAEATFREACTGVMWELGTAHRFALWPLLFMGELAEIHRRLPGLIREAEDRDDLYGKTNLCLVIRTALRLAADEPDRARAELHETMNHWSQRGFHVQHMEALYDETQIDLYRGEGLSAWRRLNEHWPLLEQSHLLRVQQVRIYLLHARARSALVAAAQAGDAGPFVAAAARDARALAAEEVPWARALAQLIRAGLAGPWDAVGLLRDAAERCDAAVMKLYAAAARRRLGELLGGAEGQRLVAEADAWMLGQTVVRPDRMSELLAPRCASVGFG